MKKALGILGGGQLARMMADEAREMQIKTIVYCDSSNSCASQKADKTIIADYKNLDSLKEFADKCDVITFEFENIPVASVEFLETIANIHPSSKVLRITQNRILEKSFVNDIGISTADFMEIKNQDDLENGFTKFGKSILKTSTLGYDGKGQFVIEKESEITKIWQDIEKENLLDHGLVLEKFCPFISESSVLVARSINGEISCYDPVTNIHKDGILDKTFYPAKISEKCKYEIREIAEKIAKEIDLFGLLAIELFVLDGDKLIVNEMAPRPHNSGHFSMDGCTTSQFKQLILATFGEKLGNTDFFTQGYMQNLIGNQVLDLEKYEIDSNAIIHIYNKGEVREGRKMGHVNLINR